MNGMELKKLMDVTVAKSVKEFAEKLKEKLQLECSGCYIPNEFERPTDEFAYNSEEVERIIDEIVKEYDVEE